MPLGTTVDSWEMAVIFSDLTTIYNLYKLPFLLYSSCCWVPLKRNPPSATTNSIIDFAHER